MEIQNQQIKFTVSELLEEDIQSLIPVLEHWIKDRNTGEPLPTEVAGVVQDMQDSLEGKNNYKYIVARDEAGKAIGVIGMRIPSDKMQQWVITQNPVELINAYVSPNFRQGKGVGRGLVEQLALYAKGLGHTEIVLNSGPRYKNSAWGFYNKVFGEPVGLAEGFYGQGGDAPIWRRIL